jgi:hypothetical protein
METFKWLRELLVKLPRHKGFNSLQKGDKETLRLTILGQVLQRRP